MPLYTVRFKDEVVTRLESDSNLVRIGRAEECEICIDNLGISRYHCVIELKNGVRVIRDLGSHNGIYFGGKLVKTRVINDGDVFVIGKYRLEFKGEVPGFSETVDIKPGQISEQDMAMKTFAIDPSALAHVQQAERVKGFLQRNDGKVVDLKQTLTTFGKDMRCDHRMGGLFTPRIQAVIVRDERGFFLLNTAGPTRVEVQGRPMAMFVRLENGMQVKIGGEAFTFQSGRATEEG